MDINSHQQKSMSSKKMQTTSMKLSILEAINEHKQILFAKFNSNVTHEMKVEAWKKVLEHANAIGMVDKTRDWIFVRDKMYGVWKSRTLVSRP